MDTTSAVTKQNKKERKIQNKKIMKKTHEKL